MNKVVLMGRITRDVEIKKTPQDISVANFSIAVDKGYQKDKERSADFFDIVAWRGTADFVGNYFQKGSMIALTGKLQTRTWQDKEGNNRKVVEVLAEEVFFTGSKGDSGNTQPQQQDFTAIEAVEEDLPF